MRQESQGISVADLAQKMVPSGRHPALESSRSIVVTLLPEIP
jgi:hypothetical protein